MEQEGGEKGNELLSTDLVGYHRKAKEAPGVCPFYRVTNRTEMVLFSLNRAPKDEVAVRLTTRVRVPLVAKNGVDAPEKHGFIF